MSNLRSLGAGELFTLAFGSIIGVSWIVLAGDWLGMAGSMGAALAFLVGGTVALLVALQYAELGSLFPRAGGELVFAWEIFGPRSAFFAGWSLLLLYLSLVAFESVSVAWLMVVIFPAIEGPELYQLNGVTINVGEVLVAFAGSLLIGWINLRGAHSVGRLQDVLTLLLIVAAALFVCFGLGQAQYSNLQPLFGTAAGEDGWKGFMALLATTPLFFAGFGVITQAMGEAREEEFSRLGRIMTWVVVAAALFYGLIILSTAGLMPREQLTGYSLPVAQAFEAAFDSALMADLVLFVGMMGLVTTWNAVFFASLRVFEGVSTRGLLPVGGADTVAGGRHFPALVGLVTLISILGGFLGRSVLLPIISVGGLAVTLLFVLVCLCNIRRRRANAASPDGANIAPYRAPGGIPAMIVALLLSLFLVGLSSWSLGVSAIEGQPLQLQIALVWAVLGVVLWRLRSGRGE